MSSPSSYHAAIRLQAAETKRKSAPKRAAGPTVPPPKELPPRPKSSRKETASE